MENKKRIEVIEKRRQLDSALALRSFSIFLLSIIMISLVSAQVSYCCEKTTYGAWCQNEEKEWCDANFQASPTACDSTSYCKQGCCFDSIEGLCSENTPQRVCEDSGGSWDDDANCNVPQCELGCCIIGDQAALVSQTRCKALTGFYGLEIDFRKSITNELVCIATANAQDKGACVFEDPETHSPTCKFTTRGECDYDFHEGILCSADELGTVCGPSTKTMLVDSGDEVYFSDTCGNPANIYDSTRYNDKLYWKKMFTKVESCGAGQSNAGSKTCGNCNYFLGSIGKKAKIGGKPTYGDYICTDLSCSGHQHGESWCEYGGGGANTGSEDSIQIEKVGTRHFKQICVNNEILVEPCADYRNEICVSQETNGFSEAVCTVNRWQDCISQTTKKKCENSDLRDCQWMADYYFSSDGDDTTVAYSVKNPSTGKKITTQGLCLPRYTPGLAFWGEVGSGISPTDEPTNRFTGAAITGWFITSRATDDGEDEEQEDEVEDEVAEEEDEDEERFDADTETPRFTAETNPFGTGAVTPRATVSATDVCSSGDAIITVGFKRYKQAGHTTSWECTGETLSDQYDYGKGMEICDYFTEDNLTSPSGFAKDFNGICAALGDCGAKTNYIGVDTADGYAVYFNGSRVLGQGGGEVFGEDDEDSDTTGSVIAGLFRNMFDKNEGDEE